MHMKRSATWTLKRGKCLSAKKGEVHVNQLGDEESVRSALRGGALIRKSSGWKCRNDKTSE